MKAIVLATLVAMTVLSGCVAEASPARVDWTVRNDGSGNIDYVIDAGFDGHHRQTGTLSPGETADHHMFILSGDGTFEVHLEYDEREATGQFTAVDASCNYRADAVWDGEEWDLDIYAVECP